MRTTAAVAAFLALALGACSSGGDDDRPAPQQTAASSATASPSVDTAAVQKACVDAWVSAIRQGAEEGDPAPAACQGIPDGEGLNYARAVRQKIQEDRARYDACLEDPSAPGCEEWSAP